MTKFIPSLNGPYEVVDGLVADQNATVVAGARLRVVILTDANGNPVVDPDGTIAIDDLIVETT